MRDLNRCQEAGRSAAEAGEIVRHFVFGHARRPQAAGRRSQVFLVIGNRDLANGCSRRRIIWLPSCLLNMKPARSKAAMH
jgi:hypothetical protein